MKKLEENRSHRLIIRLKPDEYNTLDTGLKKPCAVH
jgi:hypothetical protein